MVLDVSSAPFHLKFSRSKITCRLPTWISTNSPVLWMKTACFADSLRAEFEKQVDENAAAALGTIGDY